MLANTKSGHDAKSRMSGEERRAQIVRMAFDLFAQNGFRGTTTRELAHAVGVSEPVLYQHFPNKKELYTAIVQHIIEADAVESCSRMESILSEGDERRVLQRLGEMILAWYLDDPRIIRLLLFSSLEGHELAEIWHEQVLTAFFAPFDGRMAGWVEEGRLKKMEPTLLTRAFVGMIAHYATVTVVFKHALLPLSREETVARFVEIFISGAERR